MSPQIEITPELPQKLKPDEPPPPPLPEKKRINRKPEEQIPFPVFEPSEHRPRLTRQISTASQRGNRIIRLPHAPVSSGNRRQIGKGLVGRWLNRTIKRGRLTSAVKEQIDSLEDHRYVYVCFFLVSFCMCVCFFVCVCLFVICLFTCVCLLVIFSLFVCFCLFVCCFFVCLYLFICFFCVSVFCLFVRLYLFVSMSGLS